MKITSLTTVEGHIAVLAAPGLGIDIDWERCEITPGTEH